MQLSDNQTIIIIGLLIVTILSNIVSVKLSNNHQSDKAIFCGTKQLPVGYGRYGNLYECLKRGFGAGMNVKDKTYPFRKLGMIFIVVIIGILCYQYFNEN